MVIWHLSAGAAVPWSPPLAFEHLPLTPPDRCWAVANPVNLCPPPQTTIANIIQIRVQPEISANVTWLLRRSWRLNFLLVA